jgi:hypothetical protein
MIFKILHASRLYLNLVVTTSGVDGGVLDVKSDDTINDPHVGLLNNSTLDGHSLWDCRHCEIKSDWFASFVCKIGRAHYCHAFAVSHAYLPLTSNIFPA